MPIEVTCEQCNTQYTLRDEHAGKKLRCKQCENIIIAPLGAATAVESPAVDRGYHPAFARDKFLVNQKRMAISEKYYVFDERERPVLYIERPAHFLRNLLGAFAGILTALVVILPLLVLAVTLSDAAHGNNNTLGAIVAIGGIVLGIVLAVVVGVLISPKRHISVYTDDTKQHRLLEILQDRKFNFIRASYTVQDPADGQIGRFVKNYVYNVLRKRWYIYRADGELYMLAQEDSLLMSLLRRLLPPIITAFFARTNFIMHRLGETQILGEFNRRFTLFDKYVLDMTADRDHVLDRRMAIALGVLLDTGERR